jgi:pimeloyl-ACP methyl ester carboxylesterase
VAYTLEGNEGPPVLLIMGFGMRGGVWRPQIDALREDHRVVFYDHLGLGDSDPAPPVQSMRKMAADAERVLDALSWPDAHVVGVSMGGMIAQELALTAPGRVRSLTLIATHAGGIRAALPRVEGLARFVEANVARGPEKRVEALKKLLYTPDFLERVDVVKLDRRIADMAGVRAPRATLAGHLRAVLRHRTRTRLPALRMPTMVVRPGRDLLIHPKNGDVIARAIPGARLVRFDDAGHGVTFQCAQELNAELSRHIEAAEHARASR